MASQTTRVEYEHHGKRGDMTWQRRGQPTAKRLDYFLLSPPAMGMLPTNTRAVTTHDPWCILLDSAGHDK
eukprot:COSAG01_NODE_60877_length_292_cov_0.953368_1_plen_69_part_10